MVWATLYYTVLYCKYIAESYYENHVSTVNTTVCAIPTNLGNIDYVAYLHWATFGPKCTSVMHHVDT